MRSRMERYYEDEKLPQRTSKNDMLYDEIYSEKREPASNVTVLDNINEIDVNKIKELISNREDYKKVRSYQNLISSEEQASKEQYSFEEPESKNYDINEIIERKRNNREPIERERVRKISNTQYDILKGLNISKQEESEEMDMEFFTQEKQLKSLISTITKEKEKTIQETALDLFDNLKGEEGTEVTPPMSSENSVSFETREQRNCKEKNKDNTFYTSVQSFCKEDFDDLEELKSTVKKNGTVMKVLLILLILFILCIGFVVASNYIDFKALLK